MSQIIDITELPQGKKSVLLFWAPWHDASVPGGPLDPILEAFAGSAPDLVVGRVQAEECTTLTKKYRIGMVPTFVLLTADGNVFQKIEGCDDVPRVTLAVQALSETTVATEGDRVSTKENLNDRLKALINTSKVMLFMKGSPDAPRCGFSRQIVELLQGENVEFQTFDILSDEEVRQGLKTYSDWPTYPQLYVNGELIGGLDIVKELKEDGSLHDSLS